MIVEEEEAGPSNCQPHSSAHVDDTVMGSPGGGTTPVGAESPISPTLEAAFREAVEEEEEDGRSGSVGSPRVTESEGLGDATGEEEEEERLGRQFLNRLREVAGEALGTWDPDKDKFMKRLSTRAYLKRMKRLVTCETISWSRCMYMEHLSGRIQRLHRWAPPTEDQQQEDPVAIPSSNDHLPGTARVVDIRELTPEVSDTTDRIDIDKENIQAGHTTTEGPRTVEGPGTSEGGAGVRRSGDDQDEGEHGQDIRMEEMERAVERPGVLEEEGEARQDEAPTQEWIDVDTILRDWMEDEESENLEGGDGSRNGEGGDEGENMDGGAAGGGGETAVDEEGLARVIKELEDMMSMGASHRRTRRPRTDTRRDEDGKGIQGS